MVNNGYILNFVIYSDDDLINSDDEDDFFPSDEADESGSDDGMSFFEEEETKSRFTNYSMTSSVLRRNEGLKKQILKCCYVQEIKCPTFSIIVIR